MFLRTYTLPVGSEKENVLCVYLVHTFQMEGKIKFLKINKNYLRTIQNLQKKKGQRNAK